MTQRTSAPRGAAARGADTRDRIVEAALETVREEGFADTTARAIARHGGFNQALIFYHFGTINDLLLAALDKTSEIRMAKYRDAVEAIASLDEALRVATELYREDLASGHITVLSEMLAGSSGRPDLAPEILARLEPWIDLAEDAIRNVLSKIGLEGIAPPRALAYGINALYVGVDLLSHLENDNTKAEALFDAVKGLGSLVSPLLGGNS
jgi:AcrR family transcriptional regulator